MHLDAATLIVVMVIVGLMTLGIFVAVDRAMPRRVAGLRTWILAYACHTAVAAMLVLPPGPGILVARNLAAVAGFVLAYAATRRMVGGEPPWPALAALTAAAMAAIAWGIFAVDSFALRAAVQMTCEVILYGAASVEILRAVVPTHREGSRFLSALFASIAAVSAFRLVSLLTGPSPRTILTMSGIHVVYLTVHVVALAGVGAGVILFAHEKLRADLENEAWTDALTGLWARRAFFELAERERNRAARAGEPYALLVLDLDDFKRVNDTFGHSAGDRVLAAVASSTRTALRNADLVGRYGGEELIALLSGSGPAAAAEAAERVRAAVDGIRLEELPALRVTASLGVAATRAPGEEVDSVFRRADLALYRAKARGKNRVETDEEGRGTLPAATVTG